MKPIGTVVLLLPVLLAPAVNSRANTFVSGKVVYRDGGAVVGGASIAFYRPDQNIDTPWQLHEGAQPPPAVATTQSLANGSYVVKLPDPGKYRLLVDGSTCVQSRQILDVPAAGLANFIIQVDRWPTLRLHVSEPGGKTMAHQEVQVWLEATWGPGLFPIVEPETKTTTPDGDLDISAPHNIPLKAITSVDVALRSAAVGCGELHFDNWPDGMKNLTLEKGAILTGTVLDDAAKPLAGVRVTVVRMTNNGFIPNPLGEVSVNTGDDGSYTIPALFHDWYSVRAEIPGVGPRAKIEHLEDPRTQVDIKPSDPAWRPTLPMPGWRFPRGMQGFPGQLMPFPFGGPNDLNNPANPNGPQLGGPLFGGPRWHGPRMTIPLDPLRPFQFGPRIHILPGPGDGNAPPDHPQNPGTVEA